MHTAIVNVSIIMPCHNGSEFISEAINSIQQQTYTCWELLIIDDCSTDNSCKIIEDYIKEDNRIQLLHTEKSTGYPASVRNIGIQAANGRYIAFLDCDDKWLPTKLEKQLKQIQLSNSIIVFSWYKKMDEYGNIHKDIIKSPELINYKDLLKGNAIGNLTGMYDTKLVGKVFQKNIHHEDYLMWLEILKKGNHAVNTKTVEAIYRISKKSISNKKIKAMAWTWNIYYNELKLSFFTSLKYFSIYIIKGFCKFIK